MPRPFALLVPFGVCIAFMTFSAGQAAATTAAGNARLDRAVQGVAGTVMSVAYARELAPDRPDLAKHAAAGGAISAVVGAFGDRRLGWRTGVVVGAGKEIVNDAMLGRGCPQLDDFLVTAGAAIFAGSLSSRLAPLVYVDGDRAELRLRWAF
jgi:hypothetical protein